MRKRLLTLLTLVLGVCFGAWAATAIVGPGNMTSQAKGTLESTTDGNVWYGNGTNLASGFIIQITSNKGKAYSKQGKVTISGTEYDAFKNSNGAQNTITLPSGSYASSVTFYVTPTSTDAATLSEFNGKTISPAETISAGTTNVITKTLGNTNSFTFTFSTKQVFFVAVVTYDQPTITTQPVSATYMKDEAASALSVAATASTGDLSYQWYSCDDANKTNAAAVSGETSASYTPATSVNGTYYYFCRVTDTKGSTDSDVATITVASATAPTISASASATTVFQNASVTLTATTTGIPVPTVQWYSCTDTEKAGAAAIVGATNETYAPSTATVGTYYFYAVATSSAGSATSDVITLTVNPLYTVTYSLGDVTGTIGTVPAVVDVESSLTIPTNKTLYKAGYTLTAWNNGTSDYANGANMPVTANTTLTPVFTENSATAYLGHNTTTVTWQFQTGQGAPAWSMQGNGTETKYYYVVQTTVGGSSIDVLMTMDATNGKINNGNWSDWTQMNPNTKLTVPVLAGAVLKLYAYGEGSSKTEFEGNIGTYASNIYTYTATADGNLEVVIGNETYFKYLSVTYPSETAVLTVSANDTQVYLTNANVSSNDYLSAATNNWDNKTISSTSYSLYNLSKNDRSLTIKVTGASTFEVFVQNGTANRTYTVKVGSSAAKTITHTGTGVESSGVFAIADPSAETTITLGNPATSSASVYPFYIVFNPTVPATITSAGWATLYTDKALDFSGVSGLTAYTATCSESTVTLTPVSDVPANTGVVLKGSADTYYIPTTESSSTDKGHLLGSASAATAWDAYTGYTLYVLTQASDGVNVEFNPVTSGEIAAGKAFLKVSSGDSSLAPTLNVVFAGGTTGIDSAVKSDELSDKNYYNLAGQRVAQPTKGLYIVGGKKVVVK